MRALEVMTAAVRWRWAPFYGLIVASSLYVLFAVLVIPSSIGGSKGPVVVQPITVDQTVAANAIGNTTAPSRHPGSIVPRSRRTFGASPPAPHPFVPSPRPIPPAPDFASREEPMPPVAPSPPPPPPPPPAPPEPQEEEDDTPERAAPPPQARMFGRLQHLPAPSVAAPPDDQAGGDDNAPADDTEDDPPADSAH